MRRPAGEPDHLHGRADATVGIGKTLGINLHHARQRRALERPLAALAQRIGCAHAAQIVHQRQRRGVAHPDPVAVGDRQRKSRPLQQRAQLAYVGKGSDPRRDPLLDLGFGGGEGLPQLAQGVAADQRREQQAVRLERAADLDERPWQVVDELERERRHHEIERAVVERQRLLVGGDGKRPRAGEKAGAGQRVGCDDAADLSAPGKRAAHGVSRGAEIDRTVEAAQHRRQAIGQVLRHALDQERRGPERRRPRAARAQEVAVEDDVVRRHCGPLVARMERSAIRGGSAAQRGRPALSRRSTVEVGAPARYRSRMHGEMEAGELPERRFARLGGALRRAFALLVDVALPQLCATCREPVEDPGLCPACWSKLSFIAPPYCARLGIPFPFDGGPGLLSLEAIADPPAYQRARAAVRYDDIASKLVHALKYGDRLDLAPIMGRWMANAGRELIADAYALVPVPLHWRRQWARRFNQSALLAEIIAGASGRVVAYGALKRVKATPQQVGLGKSERAQNVQGAFRVPAEGKAEVAGRKLLLVDDVLTRARPWMPAPGHCCGPARPPSTCWHSPGL